MNKIQIKMEIKDLISELLHVADDYRAKSDKAKEQQLDDVWAAYFNGKMTGFFESANRLELLLEKIEDEEKFVDDPEWLGK